MAVALLALILAGCLVLWTYVQTHQGPLLRQIKAGMESRINASVQIRGMGLALCRSFPWLALRLDGVRVRDSLIREPHEDLLTAESIFLQARISRLVLGRLQVSGVYLENGRIALQSDSTGGNMARIFRADSSAAGGPRLDVRHIGLNHMDLSIWKTYPHSEHFAFRVDRIDAEVRQNENALDLALDLALEVRDMTFSMPKGSFLEQKKISGRIRVSYNPRSEVLQFNHILLNIDQYPFSCSGKFFIREVPLPFWMDLHADRILFARAAAMTTPNIRKKLLAYALDKPVILDCRIDATAAGGATPRINLRIRTANNRVELPGALFSACSFTGYFSNAWHRGAPRDDPHSGLIFTGFSGIWQNIAVKADTITIMDLSQPVLHAHLTSRFALPRVNDLAGNNSLRFSSGVAALDLRYRGALNGDPSRGSPDSPGISVDGTLRVDSANLVYLPRQFPLSGLKARIQFAGQDLHASLQARSENSRFQLEVSLGNLLNPSVPAHQAGAMQAVLVAAALNLPDFASLFRKVSAPPPSAPPKNPLEIIIAALTRSWAMASKQVSIKAQNLKYEEFIASRLNSDWHFDAGVWTLPQADFGFADGSVHLDGRLESKGQYPGFSLRATMDQMDIRKLFSAFQNFGQEALLDKNLNGQLHAKLQLRGQIGGKAAFPDSLQGKLDFFLQQGELIDFEPLQRVSATAFKNKDLSDVRFADLRGSWEIHGSRIVIHPMKVTSTAMTLILEGNYDLHRGPDLSIHIPLNNFTRPQQTMPLSGRRSNPEGLGLRLHANRGADGKLNLQWDPFRVSLRKSRRTPGA